MATVLGANQYGKAENRVVRIVRDTARHEIHDLNVSTSLKGAFTDAHTTGDQSVVLPTDTQKNTAFAYAKIHGVESIESYALALGRRLLDACDAADEAEIRVEQYAWDRLGDHSFVRRGGAVRTCFVTVGREGARVESGVKELTVLNSTHSEFKGFLKDEFTTLAETDDRILATSLVATWRHDLDSSISDRSTGTRRTTRSSTGSSRPSPAPTPARCRRRCSRWAPPRSRPSRGWSTSRSRRPTSTTSSSTSAASTSRG